MCQDTFSKTVGCAHVWRLVVYANVAVAHRRSGSQSNFIVVPIVSLQLGVMDVQDGHLLVLLWALRLLLPALLFWFSFGPKLSLRRGRHTREALLSLRARGEAPELIGLRLVGESEAPELFRDRDEPRHERRRRREEDAEGRGRKERRDAAEAAEATAAEAASEERRMQLESLVNFVAFRPSQQRHFFVSDAFPPPPPPKLLARPPKLRREALDLERAETTRRANAEAQIVLRGALRMRRPCSDFSVARGLYAQLREADLEVASATLELMVESCIQAGDVESTGEFLMHMEHLGHAPGHDLLDKLMELYLETKKQQEAEAKAQGASARPVEPEPAPAGPEALEEPVVGLWPPGPPVGAGPQWREPGLRRRRPRQDLPAFSVPQEFAAGGGAEEEEDVWLALGPVDDVAIGLKDLAGHWHRNGDPNHQWTIEEDGVALFNGRYAGSAYDFREERAPDGARMIYARAHRANGEELDMRLSTRDRLVWVKAGGVYSASWIRPPDTSLSYYVDYAAMWAPDSGQCHAPPFALDARGHGW